MPGAAVPRPRRHVRSRRAVPRPRRRRRPAQGRGRGRRPGRRAAASAALTGAERRDAEKERSSIDRRLEKLQAQIAEQHEKLARHDQGDYVGLGRLGDELGGLEASVAELETRWLEVSEALEG